MPPLDLAQTGACHYAPVAAIERAFADFRIERTEEMDVPIIEAEAGAGTAARCLDFGSGRIARGLPQADRFAFEEDPGARRSRSVMARCDASLA